MFCFQCEQTAGCTGCTGKMGVCGKTEATARLQDELTGALIGLARAVCGGSEPAESAYRIVIEGLFAAVTNVSFDDSALRRLLDEAHREKSRLVPGCGECAVPCGRTNDYDMRKLWEADEDIRSLKSLILF